MGPGGGGRGEESSNNCIIVSTLLSGESLDNYTRWAGGTVRHPIEGLEGMRRGGKEGEEQGRGMDDCLYAGEQTGGGGGRSCTATIPAAKKL